MKIILIISLVLFILSLLFIPVKYIYCTYLNTKIFESRFGYSWYKDFPYGGYPNREIIIRYEFIFSKHSYYTDRWRPFYTQSADYIYTNVYIEYSLLIGEWLFLILTNIAMYLIIKKKV